MKKQSLKAVLLVAILGLVGAFLALAIVRLVLTCLSWVTHQPYKLSTFLERGVERVIDALNNLTDRMRAQREGITLEEYQARVALEKAKRDLERGRHREAKANKKTDAAGNGEPAPAPAE